MLKPYTVSFFGHRIIEDFNRVEKKAETLIRDLILQKEYVEFLVGRDGDFDQIVSSTVKRQQRLVRDDNSSLIWILPYPTAELRNNMENFEAYYDEIEICGNAASSHPKGAFQIRNRQMVKRSNLVVFYVDHTGGGAYQTMRYAQKEKKNILNLAGEGYGAFGNERVSPAGIQRRRLGYFRFNGAGKTRIQAVAERFVAGFYGGGRHRTRAEAA